jgi:hypothetical protein
MDNKYIININKFSDIKSELATQWLRLIFANIAGGLSIVRCWGRCCQAIYRR